MPVMIQKLTYEQFESQYGLAEHSYEFWHGEAIAKGMPTWIHGLLQTIVIQLLTEAGFVAAAEVELRIESDARPKPDVIATKGSPQLPYPTSGVEVVVEILSEDDRMDYILQKCRDYRRWGFEHIYVVDTKASAVFEWTGHALAECQELVSGIPVSRIWSALSKALSRGNDS